MSWIFVASFVGIPAGVWIYNKTMGRTGNNTQTSIVAGVVVGIVAFLVTATLYSLVD